MATYWLNKLISHVKLFSALVVVFSIHLIFVIAFLLSSFVWAQATGVLLTGSQLSGSVVPVGNTLHNTGANNNTISGSTHSAATGNNLGSGSNNVITGNSVSGSNITGNTSHVTGSDSTGLVNTGKSLTGLNLFTGNSATGLSLGTGNQTGVLSSGIIVTLSGGMSGAGVSGGLLNSGLLLSGQLLDGSGLLLSGVAVSGQNETGVMTRGLLSTGNAFLATGVNGTGTISTITYSGDMDMNILQSTFAEATIVAGKERTNLSNDLQVYIPSDTMLMKEDLTLYTGILEAPEFVDTSRLFGQKVRNIIHIGNYDENLYFYNESGQVDITIRVPIKGFIAEEQFIVFTSQDGLEWEYHGVAKTIVSAGDAFVEFSTNHLTFFSVGSANGDFYINGDIPVTYDSTVQLQTVITGVVDMKIGNTTGERDASAWIPFSGDYQRTLPGPGGLKTVYALFRDSFGNTGTVQDSIVLDRLVRASRVEDVDPVVRTTVLYQKEYASIPVIIATPSTDNNGNNYPIPQVRNVTRTGFELKICVDAGQPQCDETANPENIDVMVFDRDVAATLSWIAVGNTTGTTDGGTTSFSYGSNLSNDPYVWTTSQTQNQADNIAAVSWVTKIRKVKADLIGCVHPGVGDSCQASQPNENFGWVAIDPSMIDVINARLGLVPVASSTWTSILYDEGITDPVLMVTQNSDNGSQDPQYAWVRNATINAAQVRFCEADGPNFCDGHSSEDLVWAAFDRQDMPSFQISFSPPELATGQVIATVIPSSGTIITNNGGTGVRIFSTNGTFVFEYEDPYGYTGSLPVTVDWILDPLAINRLVYGDIALGISGDAWTTVAFKKNYTEVPVVIVTPVTTNAANVYPIPQVRNVTTGSFELKYCMDASATTCDTGFGVEDFHYLVFDKTTAKYFDWIEIGTTTVATDGSDTARSFDTTFDNVPYIFTTSQTQNQGANISAIAWADDVTTNTMNLIGCVHQGAGDDCAGGQPSETFGYVAIDVASMSITGAQYGFSSISNSAWTPISFSPNYIDPIIMVTQNSDNGNQDPQYPWARNVLSNGADIRYCEADGFNYCDSHTAENVMWFSIERFVEPNITIKAPNICSTFPFEIERFSFDIEHTCAGMFTLQDDTGLDDGYYTTLQITHLSGSMSSILNTDIYVKSNGLVLLSGAANPNVTLAAGMTGYHVFDTPLVYIQRSPGANANLTGVYGSEITLKTTIPPFGRPDVYSGVLTYTLYDR